jgi:uncharacterized protein
MKCPTCGNPVQWNGNPFRPFCSERCQLVDLGKWVEGEYRVPGEQLPPDAGQTGQADDIDKDNNVV